MSDILTMVWKESKDVFFQGGWRSLRVATVRQAQQILSVGTIVFVFGIIFAVQAVPANVVSSLTYSQFLLIAIAVIAVLDAILLGLSLVSFQRSRLILS